MNNAFRWTNARLPLLGVVPACLAGIVVMERYGAPRSMPLTNGIAAMLGLGIVMAGAEKTSNALSRRPLAVSSALVTSFAATFLDAGLDGVHRWMRLGPLRLHLSSLVMPVVLLAIAELWQRQKSAHVMGILIATFAVHVAQPDAGQTTALALATLSLAMIPDKRLGARAFLTVVALAAAAAAWMRPDPLQGVAMVEDIVFHAFEMHVVLGIVATMALLMLPGAAAIFTWQSRKNPEALLFGSMLAGYFLGSIGAVAAGEFPTPVLGFGASPMLGAALGLGLLGRMRKAN